MRDFNLGSIAPGLNNRLDLARLGVSDKAGRRTFLHAAQNVDLSAQGFAKRRRGQTVAVEAASAHSIWADPSGAFGLAVLDGALTRLDPEGSGLRATIVRGGMASAPVSYSSGADGAVYWTNQHEVRRLIGASDLPVATDGLSSAPALQLTAGALRAGLYLYAFTVQGDAGESAATVIQQISVPAAGGLVLDAPGLAGRSVNLYLSGPDGDVLSLVQTSSAGAFLVVAPTEGGKRLRTGQTASMPPGSIVRHFKGRMLVAAGAVLYFSRPYNYGLYDAASGFIPFPAPISVVQPVESAAGGGIYIAADKTYWLPDLSGGALVPVLPFGGIPGSGGTSPDQLTAFWGSPQGLVVGDGSGAVKTPQQDAMFFGPAAYGASLHREQDGNLHVVTSRLGSGASMARATSFIEAELVRKEQSSDL
ncbi:hypothetical protein ABIC63_000511 [Pseudacidovorax sp. 1753]|uniref:hypothetical protein n=1 Tax=Pseudacidovorax sp. 1753 TaxID=3156419 RepID=UPI0033924C97